METTPAVDSPIAFLFLDFFLSDTTETELMGARDGYE